MTGIKRKYRGMVANKNEMAVGGPLLSQEYTKHDYPWKGTASGLKRSSQPVVAHALNPNTRKTEAGVSL